MTCSKILPLATDNTIAAHAIARMKIEGERATIAALAPAARPVRQADTRLPSQVESLQAGR